MSWIGVFRSWSLDRSRFRNWSIKELEVFTGSGIGVGLEKRTGVGTLRS